MSLALVLVVAMTTIPSASASTGGTKIQGYVKNVYTGTAISGATVDLLSTYGSPPLWVTHTDANGFYLIDWGTGGTFVVWAGIAGYWEEYQTVSVNTGGGVRADFNLPPDPCTPSAPLLLMFATFKSGQIQVDYDFIITTSGQTKVDDYKVPTGTTYTVSQSVQYEQKDMNDVSVIYRENVCVHGEFWKSNTANIIDAFVTSQLATHTNDWTHPDYMGPPANPPAGHYWITTIKKSGAITVTSESTYTVRTELGVGFSVNLDSYGIPISFSGQLVSHLQEGGSGNSRTLTITATVLDHNIHSVEWYWEGGVTAGHGDILHFWQLS